MREEFKILPMVSAQLDSVADLERECFAEPWTRNQLSESLAQNRQLNPNCYYLFLTAVAGEETVGYAGAQLVMGEADITNVAVRSDYRRQGIAAELMLEIQRQCSASGITQINLEVRESNLSAIHLYEKVGYQVTGRRKHFYRMPAEDAILMTFTIE